MTPLLVQPISNEESTNILLVPWIRFHRCRFHGIDRLVAAYINWTMFELPGVDLGEIAIPLLEIPGGRLPGAKEVSRMLSEASRCVDKLGDRSDTRKIREIKRQLSSFSVDPSEWEWEAGTPVLTGE